MEPRKIKLSNGQELVLTGDADANDIAEVMSRLPNEAPPEYTGPSPEDQARTRAALDAKERETELIQAEADRHDPSLTPEERGSQANRDADHYLYGRTVAGPQHPGWERVGAIAPILAGEAARPLLANSPMFVAMANVAMRRLAGTKQDEDVWNKTGGAAGEKSSISEAPRNLEMLGRGALGLRTPGEVARDKTVRAPGYGLTTADAILPSNEDGIVALIRRVFTGR